MKIAIDARFWGPRDTGLGVYTQKLVENLASSGPENNYLVILRKEAFNNLILPQNFRKILLDAQPYTLKEQILLPWALGKHKADIAHFPSINAPLLYFGRYVITVHDLIKHDFKGAETTTRSPWVYWVKQAVYLLLFRIIIKCAVKIITPSSFVKEELVRRFNLSNSKICITHEAPVLGDRGHNNYKIYNDYNLPPKFAIYTGNAYPHKNLKRLISAWRKVYKETATRLLLVCGRLVFNDRFQKMIDLNQAKDYVQLKGFVEDKELEYYYSKAIVYVFPSLSEGFGIPGLDALNCGLPLVCSDIPVFREIYGDAAHYFNPLDVDDIAEKVSRVINDKKLKGELIIKGKEHVKRYSWRKMAKQTLDIYESCFCL